VLFRLLGPLEVSDGTHSIRLGEGRQRSVLVLLLLHRNEAVASERLIDALWGEAPPARAAKMLQNHVGQLRRALGDGDGQRLQTRGHAYALRVHDGELDLDRFEELVREGGEALERDRPADAATRLRKALALWRGPPLADVAYAAFAQGEIARLEERHSAALEQRIDADLALGRHAELVAELEGLVAEHPLRERLRSQHMIALYRCGRQADALEAYGEARRALLDELGVEPGPALRDLQAAILRQDPELAPAPTAWPRPLGASPRRRAMLAAGGALLVAAAVGAAVLTGGRGHQRGLPALARTDAVVAIDPAAARVTGAIGVGPSPSHLAADGRTLWVTNGNGHSVSRVDAADGRVRLTVTVGNGPAGLAVGDGAVWVVNSLDGTVSKIAAATGKVLKEIRVGNGPSGICIGHGTVWVASSEDRAITRIDERTGRRIGTTRLDTGPTELACSASAVWASSGASGTVTRLSATTGAVVKTISTDDGASGLALADGALWVANTLAGTVSKIDPERDSVVATVPLGREDGPSEVAAGGGRVWVSNEFAGTVVGIDPRREKRVSRVHVGYRPQGLALADGALWVGVRASGAGHRGGTLRVVTQQRFTAGHFFPGSYITFPWKILSLTNDGLTAFRRTGGPDGNRVVPDLALSLPRISDAGRTYAFQMRRGIRYSDGEPVLPADIRRGLARVLRAGGPAAELYTGIVGAARCVRRPAACDLSRGVVVDDAAGSVTFHLTAPDAAFLDKLALPAAIAVSAHSDADRLPPATGPYEFGRIRPWRTLELVRNPNFREWSAAAKPDGNVAAITVRFGVKAGAAVRAVEHGEADYLASEAQLAPKQLGDIFTRFGAQVHLSPQPVSISLFLNTQVPPFNDVDARRAFNYAIDRRIAVEIEGGALAAQPTCQLLPANFPAYRPYCPYTADGTAWGPPELAKARSLVARSHTQGMHVTVWSSTPEEAREGRLAKQVLDELGYRASLRLLPLDTQVPYVLDASHRAQIGTWGFGADYPAASNVLLTYRCHSGDPSQFCDRRTDRLFARALRTETTDQIRANALWTQAEHRIVDQAAMVPLFNPNAIDLVSRRVGGVQRSPQWGVLLDQLWVR
jgi:peptide/nickel transport system substrate-binding protein